MDLVYLDYNCFQREFDDPTQLRIRLEAAACLEIFAQAESELVQLAWSFMHDDENRLCPFPERSAEVTRLARLCARTVGPEAAVRQAALEYCSKYGIDAKDAIHLGCATFIGASHFLTCDDDLLQRAARIPLGFRAQNPVEYVRMK